MVLLTTASIETPSTPTYLEIRQLILCVEDSMRVFRNAFPTDRL